MELKKIIEAADLIKNANYLVAFTGAGISVESGVPPFRGEDGLWSKYDQKILDINYFYENPKMCWEKIKEIFYDHISRAEPNEAHKILAELEKQGKLKSVITQNIDDLHQKAGSKTVFEFHGNSQRLICTQCKNIYHIDNVDLSNLPPKCSECGGLIKPDFIFFKEAVPEFEGSESFKAAQNCDVMLIIGTTGGVAPASYIPIIAKKSGAKIIDINPGMSAYTYSVADVYIQGKASEVMRKIKEHL